ncbi:hypothetical protein MMC17_004718 [Xylographa soralifera]|nr:hypothetical protein [Xylographa soralifera]
MCQKTVVTHSACGHDIEDTFPCEKFLDAGSCPSSEPKTRTEATNCPTCEDDAHLAAAMKQIETDASLAAVPTTEKDPSAPKRWAKTREHFSHCGHFANVTQQDFELEADSPEYITEELPGSCHRCCAALDWQIEQKKERGEWNEDPWGEMQKLTTAEAVRSIDGDVGPSRQPGITTNSRSAPPSRDLNTADVHPAPAAALPSARHVDYGGEDGDGDTTPEKNKGVVGRPPRTRVPEPEPEPEHHLENEEASEAGHGSEPPPNHFSDHDDDDSVNAQVPGYAQPSPEYRAYQADDSSDDEYPALSRAPRSGAPSPPSVRSYARSPPLSPSGHLDLSDMATHSGDEDVNAEPLPRDEPVASNEDGSPPAHEASASHEAEEFIEISPEERAKYAIPGLLKLTAAGFESLKRRLAENTGAHMTDYRAGKLSEKDK